METNMRKLALALAIGLLLAGSATVTAAPAAASALPQTKVVIVAGAGLGTLASTYRSYADSAAATFAKYTSNVTRVYSPSATWANVQAAAQGANILVYVGHGSGWPNPYVGYHQPNGDNGMGLDTYVGDGDYTKTYYGENYMAQLGLAPNAVVILHHLCYASGNEEWGRGLPSLAVARQRVEGYASGFLRGGAKAVIVEGVHDISYYIDELFTGHTTVDAMWKSAPSFHNHVTAWESSDSPTYTAQIDPSLDNPAPDGDYYYRSMVGLPSLSTDSVISTAPITFTSQTGTYHPIAPTRVVDTRGLGIGPTESLYTFGAYSFQIAGRGGVPDDAVAVTANVTVTNETSMGWVFLAPSINGSPGSSTVNFLAQDNRANGVSVALSSRGTLDAWFRGMSMLARTDLIIDVTGYFSANTNGYGYVAFGPKRILDTRDGTGLSGTYTMGVPRKVQVAGVSGLPSSGIVAVAGNVTVVGPTAAGWAFVGPTASSLPTSSTINFPAGDTRANNFVVPVADDGTIGTVYVAGVAGSTNLIIDISGYFTAGGGAQYNTLSPARILDSRISVGLSGPVSCLDARTLPVSGNGGVPAGATAITANLTVTGQTAGGFAAAGPAISPDSPFSNVNFPTGDNRANGLLVPLAGDGSLQLVYGAPRGNTIQLILDVTGYYK
jgi:hypothetical protein